MNMIPPFRPLPLGLYEIRRRGSFRDGGGRRLRRIELRDLAPAAFELVAEDDDEVARARQTQRAVDRRFFLEDLGQDALPRGAGREEPLAEQPARLARSATAAVVVLPQDEEVEDRGRRPGEGTDVLVPAVAGGGDDADPPPRDG